MGYPTLSLLGNMAVTLDYEHIRSRKNIDGWILGKFYWASCTTKTRKLTL